MQIVRILLHPTDVSYMLVSILCRIHAFHLKCVVYPGRFWNSSFSVLYMCVCVCACGCVWRALQVVDSKTRCDSLLSLAINYPVFHCELIYKWQLPTEETVTLDTDDISIWRNPREKTSRLDAAFDVS